LTAPAPIDDDRPLGRFGVGLAAVGFVVGLIASVVTSSIAYAVEGVPATQTTFSIAVASALGLWVGFLGVPILGTRRRGGAVELLALRIRPVVDVPLGIVAGLGSTFAAGIVTSLLLDRVERTELESKATEVIDRAHQTVGVTLLILVLCVATPIAEEVFFRGLLFRSLARLLPVPVAVVIGGAVFGLVHFTGGSASVVLNQLGLLGAFGALLCVLTWRTGRLGPAIVAHATFNLFTVAVELLHR
jgi:membrane protease YdiL (CAAX protease family)